MDLAYPSISWWPLAFVGAGLALVTLIGRSAWGAFTVGFVFSATFYLIHIVWITRYLGLIPWFALAGIETLLSAVVGIGITLVYRWIPRLSGGTAVRLLGLPAAVAAVWSARDLFLGSWPYTGFPWARIGMSQADGPLATVSSWVGVTGLGFLMIFVVASVIEWLRLGGARRAVGLAPAALVSVVLLAAPQFPTQDAGTLRVGSVQGNGPSGYFDEREAYAVLEAQRAATEPLLGQDMDLLLWPEGGIDADPLTNGSVAAYLDRLAEEVGAPLLLNAATTRGDDVYNTSFLWEAGADNPVAIHDKRNPVPMGEYVPDRWFYEAIVPDLIGLIQREYTPGTNAPYMDVDGVGVGLAICFDVIYDAVIRESITDGAQVLMFQTNNADFRDTDENLQQLGFARMRAIETGRSVVNISTIGTSQVIAPDGSVIDALPSDEPGAMLTEVPLRTGTTLGVLIGPVVDAVLGWGTAALWAALAALTLLRSRAKKNRPAARRDGSESGGSGAQTL